MSGWRGSDGVSARPLWSSLGEGDDPRVHLLHLDYDPGCYRCDEVGVRGQKITDHERQGGCFGSAGRSFILVAAQRKGRFWPLIEVTEADGSMMMSTEGSVERVVISNQDELRLTTLSTFENRGEGDEDSSRTMIVVERAFDLTSPQPVVMAVKEIQARQPSADDPPVRLDYFFTKLDEAGDTLCESFDLASCEAFCDRGR